jgi:hypothetical protein
MVECLRSTKDFLVALGAPFWSVGPKFLFINEEVRSEMRSDGMLWLNRPFTRASWFVPSHVRWMIRKFYIEWKTSERLQ